MKRRFAALFALSVAACSGGAPNANPTPDADAGAESGRGDGDIDGAVKGSLTEETWCAQASTHRCALAKSCCDASWSEASCLEDARKECEELRAKGKELGLPFSEQNARACLDAMSAAYADCKTAPGWHPSALMLAAACGSVWNGTRAVGDVCSTTAECAQDLSEPIVCAEHCARVVFMEAGLTCGPLGKTVALCVPGLVCIGRDGGAPYCDYPIGTAPCPRCSAGNVCLAGGKCGKPLVDGAFCGHAGQCASKACNDGVCGWQPYPLTCGPVVEETIPRPTLEGCTRDPGAPAPNLDHQTVETFTLEDALAGFPSASGRLVAKFSFTRYAPPGVGGPPPGDMVCVLEEKRAPITIATFVGLARGLRQYRKDRVSPFLFGKYFEGLWFPEHAEPGISLLGGTSDPLITPGYDLPRENGGATPKAGTLVAEGKSPGRSTIGLLDLWLTDAYATAGTPYAHCDLEAARVLAKEDSNVRVAAVEIARCP
jgi:hypothetical protein